MRKLIGRGAFSKAYQIGLNEVELISSCPSKECYAMFAQGNPLCPVIEKKDFDSYKMPLYPKVRSIKQLNDNGQLIYKELSKLSGNCDDLYDFLKKVDCLAIDDDQKEQIKELAEIVCNAIDPINLRFEISRRNITHNPDGSIVLLDCFFCIKTLINTRKQR